MDFEKQLFAASIDQTIFISDLHGIQDVSEALMKLERDLFALSQKKILYCKVVHGLGEGVLAEAVHAVLKNHPLVQAFQEDESGGSCFVIF